MNLDNRTKLKSELAAVHQQHPQRAYAANAALDAAFAAMDELAKLGHTFDLVPVASSGVSVAEWPKMYYRDVPRDQNNLAAGYNTENCVVVSADAAAKLDGSWKTTQKGAPLPKPALVPNGPLPGQKPGPGQTQQQSEAAARQAAGPGRGPVPLTGPTPTPDNTSTARDPDNTIA